MPTSRELEAQLDEIRAKRAALSSQVSGLNAQHSTSNSALLGGEFAAMDKMRFNSALKPLLMQDRILHQQEQQLTQAINRSDRDSRRAITDQNAASRAAVQAQKAEVAAKKDAATALEDASARAFGLGPKKGINYVTQQGAFYDPIRKQVAVPDSRSSRSSAVKDIKGDANALKQVQAEISQIAKNAGVQGPVNPSSFFDQGGFDMKEDDEGNYVYDVNGTPVTVPAATAERLQDRYNDHFPTPGESSAPSGVKYIPVETFQQAHAALNKVSGVPVLDPVTAETNRASRARQAAAALQQQSPAIVIPANPAIPGAESDVIATPTTVPSIGQMNSATQAVPTQVNVPGAMAYLNSGVNPVFAEIAAKREMERRQPIATDQQTLQSGGLAGSPREITADILEGKRSGLNPAQAAELAAKRAQIRNQKEAMLPEGQNVPEVERLQNIVGNDLASLASVGSSAAPYAGYAMRVLNPAAVPFMIASKAGNALEGAISNSFVGQTAQRGLNAIYNPQPDIYQSYLDAKAKREIGPEVTPQQYADRVAQTAAESVAAAAQEPSFLVP